MEMPSFMCRQVVEVLEKTLEHLEKNCLSLETVRVCEEAHCVLRDIKLWKEEE